MPSCLSAQQRWKPLSCVLIVSGEEYPPENKDSIFKGFKGLTERSIYIVVRDQCQIYLRKEGYCQLLEEGKEPGHGQRGKNGIGYCDK
ncbi:hypothetical protein KY290_020862 [Solanum tuberosum]|uniref:Uncharacterized protein n=1 Tax=Solanum tuberosum TaxID=4113 RepID=A0ABQ7UZX2_SOLTU|nr:hypothetical protein KY290_020862 [Solanum tuberosum]